MDINKYCADKIKYYRKRKNITQQELAEVLQTSQQQVARLETNQREIKQDVLFILADYFNISINDFFPPTTYDNAEQVGTLTKIAIYGSIKAGVPLESQTDIVGYMDVPNEWVKGKSLFGLKISGDSMFPKYQNGDTVIFEQTNDIETYKNKDCAVMINGSQSTFKKVLVNEKGIVLQPYNENYSIMFFTNEEATKLPITILGVARKKVSDIE